MHAETEKTLLYVGLGAAAFLFLFPQLFGRIAGTVGVSTGKAVVDTATGLVVGVGESVGIPPTDAQLCDQYVKAGDWWNASFYCPAGTYLKDAAGAVWDTATGALVGQSAPTGSPDVIAISSPEESGLAPQEIPAEQQQPDLWAGAMP
jgi:hypothetical protein